MSVSTSDWFNSLSDKSNKEQDLPCETKKGDCMQVLREIQYILDGEATKEQQKHFENHVEDCMPCFEQYNLDKSIKLAIQTKLCKKDIPSGLIEDIKTKINNIV